MRWKILSLTLLATLVGVTWGTFVYPKLPIASVQAQSISTSGKARIGVAPRIISYQGYLKDSSSGQPVSNGNRTAVFSLYTSDSGGSRVWQETKTIVTRNGVFRTILGQTYPINPSIVAVPELWLGVRLPPDAEMTPRQRITGSVYSVGATEAQVADTVSASPEQIAQRKWYGLNRATPPRVDIAWSLAYAMRGASINDHKIVLPGNNLNNYEYTFPVVFKDADPTEGPFTAATYPSPSIFQPVSALGALQSRWGVHAAIASVGDALIYATGEHSGFLKSEAAIGSTCYSLTSLEIALVCATSTKLIITYAFEPTYLSSTALPGQVYSHRAVACADCRFSAFDGENIWATSYGADTLNKIAIPLIYEDGAPSAAGSTNHSAFSGMFPPFPKAPEIVASYPVGKNPMGVEFDGDNLWVANSGDDTVSVIKTSTGALLQTITVGDTPTKVLYDGASVWVLNTVDDTVTQIDAISRSVIGTFTGGNGTVDISFDGYNLWIANQDDDTITLLRGTDGSQVNVLNLPGSPRLLQFDGQGTWVATLETQPDFSYEVDSDSHVISGKRWFLTRY